MELGSMINLGLERIEEISSGGFHNCAISSLGNVYCWGWNGFGQLGQGFYSNIAFAVEVDMPSGFIASDISLGISHSCAEDEVRMEIICWGSNQFGQIERSEQIDYPEPISFSSYQEYDSLIIGDYHSCLLMMEGNFSCQSEKNLDLPTISNGIVDYSAGDGFLCLISFENRVSCHGSEVLWNLNSVPREISSLKVVSEVIAGSIVGSANQNSSSNHLIVASNDRSLATEISIKIEFGNDSDGDGWNDLDEKDCGKDPLDANVFPTDWDDDGICDDSDWDDDGDFVADVRDVFPYDPNEWRDDDKDGIGRNADSIEVTGAMFGASITLLVLVILATLEIRVTFFKGSKN